MVTDIASYMPTLYRFFNDTKHNLPNEKSMPIDELKAMVSLLILVNADAMDYSC